jgi:hypothetical protein
MNFPLINAQSGGYDFGDAEAYNNLWLGDDPDNHRHVSYLTFDMSTLPEGAVVTAATLQSVQESANGDPYANLNSGGPFMRVSSLTYEAVGDALVGASFEDTLCEAISDTNCSADVTDGAKAAIEAGVAPQFYLGFSKSTNTDGSFDWVKLTKNATILQLGFIAP